MAFLDGWNSSLLMGGYDLTSWLKSAEVTKSMDVNERTTWGNGGNRSYRPGLVDGKVSFNRFDDEGDGAGVDGVAEILRSYIRVNGTPVTISDDVVAVGGSTIMLNAILADSKRSGDFEGIREGANEIQSTGGMEDGVWLKTLAAETSNTNGSSVDNGAATTVGWVAHQHVTAKSGTSPSLTTLIEHSTDNSTWATLTTFTATGVVGSERRTGAGTVNRYRRRRSTITGTTPSLTHAVALATY